MRSGDRVVTPMGPGTIGFVRFAPPDFTKVASASVKLDARAGDASYVGTMFDAGAIRLEETQLTELERRAS